jgi:hypothetical protein
VRITPCTVPAGQRCTRPPGVEHTRGRTRPAAHRRCGTAAAACMAGARGPGPRTGGIGTVRGRVTPSRPGASSRRSCGRRGSSSRRSAEPAYTAWHARFVAEVDERSRHTVGVVHRMWTYPAAWASLSDVELLAISRGPIAQSPLSTEPRPPRVHRSVRPSASAAPPGTHPCSISSTRGPGYALSVSLPGPEDGWLNERGS